MRQPREPWSDRSPGARVSPSAGTRRRPGRGSSPMSGSSGRPATSAAELIRLLARHPHVRDRRAGRARPRPRAGRAGSIPTSRRPASTVDAAIPPSDAVFLALPHGAAAGIVPDLVADGRRDHRPRAGLPPPGPGGLPALVRLRASRARSCSAPGRRTACRSSIAASCGPSRTPRPPIVGAPGCYPTATAPRARTARPGRPHRRPRRRCEERRVRGGPRAEGGPPVRRGQRERQGVRDRRSSPRRRDRSRSWRRSARRARASAPAPTPAPWRSTSSPHLIPMTRGILSTCYVRPTRPVSQAELDGLYADAYADEPFVLRRLAAAGDQARHRQQPARVHVRLDERSGPDHRHRRDRQPRQGRGRPGGPGVQPGPRPARDGRAWNSSRWPRERADRGSRHPPTAHDAVAPAATTGPAELPAPVEDRAGRAGRVPPPARTTAGIKASGRPDLASSPRPAGRLPAAAVFTPNPFAAAPVRPPQAHLAHTPGAAAAGVGCAAAVVVDQRLRERGHRRGRRCRPARRSPRACRGRSAASPGADARSLDRAHRDAACPWTKVAVASLASPAAACRDDATRARRRPRSPCGRPTRVTKTATAPSTCRDRAAGRRDRSASPGSPRASG